MSRRPKTYSGGRGVTKELMRENLVDVDLQDDDVAIKSYDEQNGQNFPKTKTCAAPQAFMSVQQAYHLRKDAEIIRRFKAGPFYMSSNLIERDIVRYNDKLTSPEVKKSVLAALGKFDNIHDYFPNELLPKNKQIDKDMNYSLPISNGNDRKIGNKRTRNESRVLDYVSDDANEIDSNKKGSVGRKKRVIDDDDDDDDDDDFGENEKSTGDVINILEKLETATGSAGTGVVVDDEEEEEDEVIEEDEHDDDYAVDHYNSDDDAGGEEGETEATF